jgi:thioesterase domain-containing protein
VDLLVLIDTVFGRRSVFGFVRTLLSRFDRRIKRVFPKARTDQDGYENASASPILSRCIREARRYRPGDFAGRVLLAQSNETLRGGFASWNPHLRGSVIVQRMDGDHLSLILNPVQVEQLAVAMRQAVSDSASERRI